MTPLAERQTFPGPSGETRRGSGRVTPALLPARFALVVFPAVVPTALAAALALAPVVTISAIIAFTSVTVTATITASTAIVPVTPLIPVIPFEAISTAATVVTTTPATAWPTVEFDLDLFTPDACVLQRLEG